MPMWSYVGDWYAELEMRRSLKEKLMHIKWIAIMFLTIAVVALAETSKRHRDYVPDEQTAVRIAEAVLVGQFGKERVRSQLPLRAQLQVDEWFVGAIGGDKMHMGGKFAVWINKYSGCLKVIEKMK